jgi:hypothetical protein
MVRFRGVSLPGFALGAFLGATLLVTPEWHSFDPMEIGGWCLGLWLLADAISAVVVLGDERSS